MTHNGRGWVTPCVVNPDTGLARNYHEHPVLGWPYAGNKVTAETATHFVVVVPGFEVEVVTR